MDAVDALSRARAGAAPPRVMMITDAERSGLGLEELARAAAGGGVDVVQVREPRLTDGALVALVRRVRAAVAGTGARVVVNERFDVALAAGADGVHLKSNGLDARQVRAALDRLAPAGFLLGLSTHRADELAAAPEQGVDYCTVSPLHEAGPGKQPLEQAGLATLLAAARALGPLPPVVILGGVQPGDAPAVARCMRQGEPWGLAAIRPFARAATAEDAHAAARGFREALAQLPGAGPRNGMGTSDAGH